MLRNALVVCWVVVYSITALLMGTVMRTITLQEGVGVWDGGREREERERERPLAVADVAPAAVQFIARSLYYHYMLLGTKNINHTSTGGPGAVYTRTSVRLEPGEVMKTNEAATKADLANQLN